MQKYISFVLSVVLTLLLVLFLSSVRFGDLSETSSLEDIFIKGSPSSALENSFLRDLFNKTGLYNLTFGNVDKVDVRRNLYTIAAKEGENSAVMVVSGAAHTNYLRQSVYITYENGVWLKGREETIQSSEAPIKMPLIYEEAVKDEITIKLMNPIKNGNLFTALYTTKVDSSVPLEYLPEYNLFSRILRQNTFPVCPLKVAICS